MEHSAKNQKKRGNMYSYRDEHSWLLSIDSENVLKNQTYMENDF